MATHVLAGRGEVASIVLVWLKENDVELWQEVERQGNVGRQREADAGGDHLPPIWLALVDQYSAIQLSL